MNTIMTDKTWIDLFIVELRMRHVPGSAIGTPCEHSMK